jgi:di/tricarboxylate transporter
VHGVQDLLSQHGAIVGLALLILIFIAFVMERRPPVVIAVLGAVVMMALGYLSTERLLEVFSNKAPITIAAMFVITGALTRTGVLEQISSFVLRRTREKPRIAFSELALGTVIASGFMNNTPVVIVLIPVIKRLAKHVQVASTRLLIPLSYLTMLGGTLTLIGTSTNLRVDGVAHRYGEPAFGLFEITGVGIVTAYPGLVFLLMSGRFLLPDGPADDAEREAVQFLSELALTRMASFFGTQYGDGTLAKRLGIKLLGLRRGSQIIRKDLDELVATAGDRLIVAVNTPELVSLANEPGISVGLKGVAGAVRTAGLDASPEFKVVEAVIAANNPGIGNRLAELPLLSFSNVRVLGISRPRHIAGPDLASARVRAGDRLLVAARSDTAKAMRGNVGLVDVAHSTVRAYQRKRAPIAVLTLIAVVIGAAVLGFPIEGVALAGVATVLVTRCLDPEDAWASIDGNTLVLIFSMLAFGAGLQNAGTVDMIVQHLTPILANAPFFVLLAGVYAVASILTEAVTNNAVAVILTPIVIGFAESLGVDARPLLMVVMFGASASFATPVGYQTNTLVYGAGNYRFNDFLKIGVPMNIVVGIATCAAITILV